MDGTLDKNAGTISAMFNRIAPRYDRLNHILSLNIDRLWRKKSAAFLLGRGANTVLDIACGTGDSTIGIYRKGMEVTGADIAEKMVEVARAKTARLKPRLRPGTGQALPLPRYVIASAEALPFPEASFDAVSISFGIRNFDRRAHCLNEIFRVIRPGGCVAILEFAKPRNRLIRSAYNLYFNRILPVIGRIASRDPRAYAYLAESVEQFPRYEDFCSEIRAAGFTQAGYRTFTAGIAVLYTGFKNES